ncbi:MAG: GNAT family N-acetyltransferase [Burkholderiales bacterium]
MPIEPAGGFALRDVTWDAGAAQLRAVRTAVFVVEQNIPDELEWDEHDAVSAHAIAEDRDGVPIGCGRLLPDGHIGRLAVLEAWRGRGVGAALLLHFVELARSRGHPRAILNAQEHAVPFYARYGFVPSGPPFMEAGIPHREMVRDLTR